MVKLRFQLRHKINYYKDKTKNRLDIHKTFQWLNMFRAMFYNSIDVKSYLDSKFVFPI